MERSSPLARFADAHGFLRGAASLECASSSEIDPSPPPLADSLFQIWPRLGEKESEREKLFILTFAAEERRKRDEQDR